MILYHGSTVMVEKPIFGFGKVNNDYGQGFYCTEDIELAKEWACRDVNGGLINSYEFDMTGLTVLDLDKLGILPWIAVLIDNRKIRYSGPLERQAAEFIVAKYLPSYEDYDVIMGYRADDSYFSYTRAFLSNGLSVEQLETAIRFGNLGMQMCLKSRKGFSQIKFIKAEAVDGSKYYPSRMERDNKARDDFYKLLEDNPASGIYIRDILREGGAEE